MSGFAHLHLHSEYSLLDGACRVTDIPRAAKEAGHTAVAITDHGVMYGVVAFYRACEAEGIKPIIGCEVYVAPRTRFDKTREFDAERYHLVLLAENETGYKNLLCLVSKGYTEGFYGKPSVDIDLLAEHSRGIIALSACLAGRIPRLILNGDLDGADEYALKMKKIFGERNFYLELQSHGIEEQERVNRALAAMSDRLDIPLVATNDVHYIKKADADVQAILMCVQTNSVISDGRPLGFETDEFYYKSTDEMTHLFGKYSGAIKNTVEIADRCNFEYDFKRTYLPAFHPGGEHQDKTSKALLRELVFNGLKKRIVDKSIVFDGEYNEEDYKMRAEYELTVIISMGYADYFLIVWDFVNYAKTNGIPTGPGRGSGTGSLVAYLLSITDVDPVKYKLVFEAFLNPQRVSMPDFDIDFCYERRDEVIKYVVDKYGQDHVSQIITFGTLAARAAVRDVGRALGMSYADVDAVAKQIPRRLGITLAEAIKQQQLKVMYEGSPQIKRLLDTAASLEGMPRHASTHAAGVVITDLPVIEYVPLAVSSDTVVTQFDMDTIESLGLLKFDFLALRYLTIISNTEKRIKESEPSFSIEKVLLDDAETFALISQGHTDGLFQLESGGMRQMLAAFKPESVEDIMIAIALYRPGPMDSIPKFLENRKNREKITYPSPQLNEILEETYGCIVYQEQVMQIFRSVAGYSYGRADIVRRAISKKKADIIEKEKDEFIRGAENLGMSSLDAGKLFGEMEDFSNYGFKKSHAAAYAVLSYRTAYLKCHYPAEYLAELLTSVLGNAVKTAQYIAECARYDIKVLPPDINKSGMLFHADAKTIRFGLLAIKNVGHTFVRDILIERSKKPFSTFIDFIERMSHYELNKRQIESLIKAGVFDKLGVYRSKLCAAYEKIVDSQNRKGKSNIEGQIGIFNIAEGGSEPDYKYPDIPEFTAKQMMLYEKSSSGVYLTGHLLDDYSEHIDESGAIPVGEILDSVESGSGEYQEKSIVRVAGMITQYTSKNTKNGDAMAFMILEDRYAEIELIAFPKTLADNKQNLAYERTVIITGEITHREDEPAKLIIRSVEPLIANGPYRKLKANQAAMAKNIPQAAHPLAPMSPSAPRQDTPPLQKMSQNQSNINKTQQPSRTLYLRVPDMTGELFKKTINLVEIFDGGTPVVFYAADTGKYAKSSTLAADADVFLLGELAALLGRENVVLK